MTDMAQPYFHHPADELEVPWLASGFPDSLVQHISNMYVQGCLISSVHRPRGVCMLSVKTCDPEPEHTKKITYQRVP